MHRESTKENKPTGIRTLINVWRPLREWLRQRPSPTPTVTSTSATVVVEDTDDEASSFYRHQKLPSKHPQPPLPQPPPPNSTVNGLVDQQFSRTARARMSLPIMQHQNNKFRQQVYPQLHQRSRQTQSLGHIYLQHMGETKQANLPNELTALDTIRALFVCAFPNMLTMHFMSQTHVKIYIYNPSCNIFYELRDIGDVRHESVLRIHQSDPNLALQQQQQATLNRSTTPFQHQINSNSQTLPPPKPRRMIPVNGLPPSPPDMIYSAGINGTQQQQVQSSTIHSRPLHQLSQQQLHHINQQRKFHSYTPSPVHYQQPHYQTIHQQRSPHQQMQINNNQPLQQSIYSTANLHQLQHQQMQQMQPMLPPLSHQ